VATRTVLVPGGESVASVSGWRPGPRAKRRGDGPRRLQGGATRIAAAVGVGTRATPAAVRMLREADVPPRSTLYYGGVHKWAALGYLVVCPAANPTGFS